IAGQQYGVGLRHGRQRGPGVVAVVVAVRAAGWRVDQGQSTFEKFARKSYFDPRYPVATIPLRRGRLDRNGFAFSARQRGSVVSGRLEQQTVPQHRFQQWSRITRDESRHGRGRVLDHGGHGRGEVVAHRAHGGPEQTVEQLALALSRSAEHDDADLGTRQLGTAGTQEPSEVGAVVHGARPDGLVQYVEPRRCLHRSDSVPGSTYAVQAGLVISPSPACYLIDITRSQCPRSKSLMPEPPESRSSPFSAMPPRGLPLTVSAMRAVSSKPCTTSPMDCGSGFATGSSGRSAPS